MTVDEYDATLRGGITVLERIAKRLLDENDMTDAALLAAQQFCAITQAINVFGRMLETIDDTEEIEIEFDPADAN